MVDLSSSLCWITRGYINHSFFFFFGIWLSQNLRSLTLWRSMGFVAVKIGIAIPISQWCHPAWGFFRQQTHAKGGTSWIGFSWSITRWTNANHWAYGGYQTRCSSQHITAEPSLWAFHQKKPWDSNDSSKKKRPTWMFHGWFCHPKWMFHQQLQHKWNNVNPGLINPKRLVNWGGTIKKYWMKWLLEEYPPNCHKPWFNNPGLTLL